MSARRRQPQRQRSVEGKDAAKVEYLRDCQRVLEREPASPAAEQPTLFAVATADAERVVPAAPFGSEGNGAGRRRAPGRVRPATPGEALSWAPVELAPLVAGLRAGEIVGPVPELMARTDGACLLYPGKVHQLQGEPESGKGWIALAAVSSSVTAGASVLYIDFEDTPVSIIERLLALGTAHEAIVARFAYVRPCDPFTPEALTALLVTDYALAVIDGLSEAYELLGLNLESNEDAVKFLRMLPRPIAECGAAVLEVDHVAKSRETRGRYAIGAQHKLAGITAAYGAEVVRVPSRTDAGLVKLMVRKDRPGHVRAHARGGVIALAHITPADNGERVTVALEPPGDAGTVESSDRPTAMMARVASYVENEPGAGVNDIRSGVKGKASTKDLARRLLIAEGYVECHEDGQASRHYSVRAFDENAEPPTASQPCPNRVPDTVQPTAPPCPTPIGGDTVGRGASADRDNGHGDLTLSDAALDRGPTEGASAGGAPLTAAGGVDGSASADRNRSPLIDELDRLGGER